jgi:hypothetical protein
MMISLKRMCSSCDGRKLTLLDPWAGLVGWAEQEFARALGRVKLCYKFTRLCAVVDALGSRKWASSLLDVCMGWTLDS